MRGRDLPFPLLHDATAHTRNAYLLGDRPRFMLLDPRGLVARGGCPAALAEILKDARRQRTRAAEFLARLKAEKSPRKAARLIAEIAAEGGEGAARALVAYGGEVKDRACQLALLESLGRLGWLGAGAFLRGERGLEAREPAVREAAVAALGALGDAAALPDLLELLRAKTPEPGLVGAACAALARIAPSDPGAREAIAALCACKNAACRGHALEGLVALGCPGAPALLAGALSGDESAPVRLKAAQLLGRIKSPDAIPLLRKSAEQDRSPAVRKAAEAALKELEAGG